MNNQNHSFSPSTPINLSADAAKQARHTISLISVIVPVYNVPPKLLRECLDALVRQTLRQNEFEIVLVDDCSSDRDTLAEVDRFVSRYANVRLVCRDVNGGLNEARITGVKASRGEYVVFVDGDDILTRDAIENLRMEALRTKADIVTAPLLRWRADNFTYADYPNTGEALPGDYVKRLEIVLQAHRSFTMCGRLFRRTILDNGETLSLPPGRLHEDVTTFVRLMFRAQVVAHTRNPIYFYTVNAASITSRFTAKHAEGMLAGIEDWIRCANEAGLYDRLARPIAIGAERMMRGCVERCVFNPVSTDTQKVEVLDYIRTRYAALDIPRLEPTLPAMKFLAQASIEDLILQPETLRQGVTRFYPNGEPESAKPPAALKHGLGPSRMAANLRGKIVFVGQVDYHVRSAAKLAEHLQKAGHACAILDNSNVVAGGKRKLSATLSDMPAGVDHIRVEECPYPTDWLATAKLVIVFNDNNTDFRDALEYRNRLGLPSVCMVEGISDFLRVDFDEPRFLPYRRCDYVFLAGNHDKTYFGDRQADVIGMPVIETLVAKAPVFPQRPLAVLNVNFTYGALEHRRDEFVQAAKDAFDALGLDWAITKHPMDNAPLTGLPVSTKTQYELIDEGSVFVSRFATGLLEALASGKPVIYFNPHGERVEKFKEPMGAFEVATSAQELKAALQRTLQDVQNGVDFRARARRFLEHHTAYSENGPTIAARFTECVSKILQTTDQRYRTASEFFSAHIGRPTSTDHGIPVVAARPSEFIAAPASAPPASAMTTPTPATAPTQTPPPERLAFYAPFGQWLKRRSPEAFALLRTCRRAAVGLWRRRALTIPAALLLAVLPIAAFWPGLEQQRLVLLGAGALFIMFAAVTYIGLRMYEFALSASAEARRLSEEVTALRAFNEQLELSTLTRTRAVEATSSKHRAALENTLVALRADLSQRVNEVDARTAALKQQLDWRVDSIATREETLRDDIDASLRAIAAQHESLRSELSGAKGDTAAALKVLEKAVAEREAAVRAEHASVAQRLAALTAAADQRETGMRAELGALLARLESLKVDDASLRGALKAEIQLATEASLRAARKEIAKERPAVVRLRERVAASERQIGALRHPSTPSTLVFFGHHKCASRFFRNEVFSMVAEVTDARLRSYKIKTPPFHYSMSDELDLVNIDFTDLGKNGRDVLLFSNASARSLERLNRATQDWKGVRILRDPRQVLVSNYFHHKGEHVTESNGWVWDQLAHDKPILRQLPIEEGLLYELDSISKQIIETQILAPFDDPRILTIKIEDFSANPKAYLEQISDFLGVASIAGLDFSRTAANPESGPWIVHFTSKLRAVFKERYGQALIDLGYAEDLHW